MTRFDNIGEYLPKYDVYIQYLPLPARVDAGVTTVRAEPVAIVNIDLDDLEKLRAIAHEIAHLLRGDLHRDEDIRRLEDLSRLFVEILRKYKE